MASRSSRRILALLISTALTVPGLPAVAQQAPTQRTEQEILAETRRIQQEYYAPRDCARGSRDASVAQEITKAYNTRYAALKAELQAVRAQRPQVVGTSALPGGARGSSTAGATPHLQAQTFGDLDAEANSMLREAHLNHDAIAAQRIKAEYRQRLAEITKRAEAENQARQALETKHNEDIAKAIEILRRRFPDQPGMADNAIRVIALEKDVVAAAEAYDPGHGRTRAQTPSASTVGDDAKASEIERTMQASLAPTRAKPSKLTPYEEQAIKDAKEKRDERNRAITKAFWEKKHSSDEDRQRYKQDLEESERLLKKDLATLEAERLKPPSSPQPAPHVAIPDELLAKNQTEEQRKKLADLAVNRMMSYPAYKPEQTPTAPAQAPCKENILGAGMGCGETYRPKQGLSFEQMLPFGLDAGCVTDACRHEAGKKLVDALVAGTLAVEIAGGAAAMKYIDSLSPEDRKAYLAQLAQQRERQARHDQAVFDYRLSHGYDPQSWEVFP